MVSQTIRVAMQEGSKSELTYVQSNTHKSKFQAHFILEKANARREQNIQ